MSSSGEPRVMAILNVTPDSFSDGGRFATADSAIEAGLRLSAEGADIIDVGGESTRPGSSAVPPDEEIRRVVPVVAGLAQAGVTVSIDTRNAATMRAALAAGARIVNDVSALTHDPAASAIVAMAGCPVILMHSRGTPATMNSLTHYTDVMVEVRQELMDRVSAALRAGIAADRIILDPGIGFAKTAEQSMIVLRNLNLLTETGYPVLAGVSRKSFIGRISREPDAARRLGGSLAAALFAVSHGASILRVHDVRETVQAIRVWRALTESGTVSLSL